MFKYFILFFTLFFSFSFNSKIFAETKKVRIAQELSWKGQYDDAIASYKSILSTEPENLEALEGLADVLSWKNNFAESIQTYDKLLAKKFDAGVARKRARVLSWKQDFRGAIDAYDQAYKITKDEGSRLEGLAKQAWWNNHILTAIDYYRQLLKIEPDNLEARSDLAQIEAYSGLPQEAVKDYSEITTKYDWHFRAQEGLEKTNIVYNKPSVNLNTLWFSSTSADRYTYIRRSYTELLFNVPVHKNYALIFGYNLDHFSYPGSSSIVRNYGES